MVIINIGDTKLCVNSKGCANVAAALDKNSNEPLGVFIYSKDEFNIFLDICIHHLREGRSISDYIGKKILLDELFGSPVGCGI